jgi:hypothetical protein
MRSRPSDWRPAVESPEVVMLNERGDALYRGRFCPRPSGSPLDPHYSYLHAVVVGWAIAVVAVITVALTMGDPSLLTLLVTSITSVSYQVTKTRLQRRRWATMQRLLAQEDAANLAAGATPSEALPAESRAPRLEMPEQLREMARLVEVDLPYVDYDSGKIWTPAEMRLFIAERRRAADNKRSARIVAAEADLSKVRRECRRWAGGPYPANYQRGREAVELAETRLDKIKAEPLVLTMTDEPPVIPGEVHPSEEVWVDEPEEAPYPEEVETREAEKPVPQKGVTIPPGGKLARLSDGTTVALTRDDLSVLRSHLPMIESASQSGRLNGTITLPSGVLLTGEEFLSLARDLKRGKGDRKPITAPPGGKLMQLSDGGVVPLTRNDLSAIRALADTRGDGMVMLPSGVRLRGDDVRSLARELSGAPRPGATRVPGPRLSEVIRMDMTTAMEDREAGRISSHTYVSLMDDLTGELRTALDWERGW